MQRNQYKQNLALANCTYINIFFFPHKAFHGLIYYIQFFFILFKKVPFGFTAVLLKQRLEHHAPKENEVKRKLPYKLVKIVCYKVLKSLQHWEAVECWTLMCVQVASSTEWMGPPHGKAAQTVHRTPWVCRERAKGPEYTGPENAGGSEF